MFLKRFLLSHANFARRDTFLQAAADFLMDPLFCPVLSLPFWRRSAASLQILSRFLGFPTGIIAASSMGIS
jgi:hypothetical protein